ncbi:YceI family protein [Candidatus Poriferisodalis sp.]|uniref:YceI family protein n=1 Tax=Candidatus Poriferisodalis sp. TaxID=3101277 RepID=UPI003B5C870E
MRPRRRTVVTVVVLLVIVAAAAAVGVWRVLGSSPEEVSLAEAVADAELVQEDATPGATTTVAAADDESSDAAPEGGASDHDRDQEYVVVIPEGSDADAASPSDDVVTIDDINGSWAVDAETGSFTLEDATGSFAGFRVDEELASIGAFTAVGRTGAVSGTMEIVSEHVTSVEIEVDLTTLQTDDRRRDGAVQRALGASRHPTAAFSLTEDLHIEGAAVSGTAIMLPAPGDLTVNGITRPVVVDIQAQLVGSVIAVVGSVEVTFADFDVTVPQVPVVLSAEDHGIMEFQLLFRRR